MCFTRLYDWFASGAPKPEGAWLSTFKYTMSPHSTFPLKLVKINITEGTEGQIIHFKGRISTRECWAGQQPQEVSKHLTVLNRPSTSRQVGMQTGLQVFSQPRGVFSLVYPVVIQLALSVSPGVLLSHGRTTANAISLFEEVARH